MRVIACGNHSPDYVLVLLDKKLGIKAESVQIVPDGEKLPKRSNRSVFFFLSPACARFNMEIINSKSYRGKKAFVFGSPLQLIYLDNIVHADFKESDDVHIDALLLDKFDTSIVEGDDTEMGFSVKNYVEKVQEKVESFTGILTQFMTFIYSTPSSTHQKPIKELACRWLCSKKSVDVLGKKLDDLSKTVPLTDRQKKRFMDLVTSPSALTYKQALAEAKHLDYYDGDEFKAITNKYGVSGYEMRYILSINNSSKS